MPRFIRGITLSAAERVRAGYGLGVGGRVYQHTCTVTLPDGSACEVRYTRVNGKSHRFDFGPPVSERLWSFERLEGPAALEEKAQALVAQAFRAAQEAEQQTMRRATRAVTESGEPPLSPRLSTKQARRLAGLYAVCLKFTSGQLLQVGRPVSTPDEAVADLRSGTYDHYALQPGQAVVIGICNRAARRWQEPQLLAERICLTHQPAEATPAKKRRRRRAAASKTQPAAADSEATMDGPAPSPTA